MILEADRPPQCNPGLPRVGDRDRDKTRLYCIWTAKPKSVMTSIEHITNRLCELEDTSAINGIGGTVDHLRSFMSWIKSQYAHPMPSLPVGQKTERPRQNTQSLNRDVLGRIKRHCGFTLIEVLITLAIVAIIAAIAVPSFQQQIRQARRADGQTALMRLAIAQEQFRSGCPRYASQIGGTRGCAASADRLGASALSTDGHYTLAVESATSSAFKLTATPIGAQVHDKAAGVSCNPLAIDQDGHRQPRQCW